MAAAGSGGRRVASESGTRTGYDETRRRRDSKIQMAMDSLAICWPCTSPRLTRKIGATSRRR
jgi:hypothetical protein